MQSVARFLGVGEIDDGTKERYRQRREKCYRTDLKDQGDEVDFGRKSCVGRKQCKPRKRESLFQIVGKAVGAKDKSGKVNVEEKMRSFAPADLNNKEKFPEPSPADVIKLKEDLFYDEIIKDEALEGRNGKGESHMDMAMERPREVGDNGKVERNFDEMDMPMSRHREEEDHDEVDVGPDIPLTDIKPRIPVRMISGRPAMNRIPDDITRELATKPDLRKKKREAVFDQLCDSAKDFFCCKICRCSKKDGSLDKRPYFSYFITFVQVVIMIAAVAVYGFARPHYSKVEDEELVLKPSLSIELVRKSEFGNIWLGPRQDDLIHLGAKYSPCMRKDPNLVKVLKLDREEEKTSGCCVRDDGAGCVQTVESQCSNLISTFVKWNTTKPSSLGFTSGAVCGQDPKYCKKPSSIPPFEWNKNDMTEWPLCLDTRKPGYTQSGIINQTDRHMTCEMLGRPCCHGMQGECMITTREHCDFLRGYYHDEAFLCSQVNCFEEVCGMIPFVYADRPDQFSRVWSSNLLHAGFVHMLISFFFQMIVMARVEQLYGSLRIMFIYVGSGTIGTLASCTLLPYHVETGPAGAHFGILACVYVDILYNILNNWQNDKSYLNAGLKSNLGIYSLVLLVLFICGLLPWVDNWAHLFGFVSGALLSLVLIKDIQIEDKGLTKLRIIVVSLALFVLMFVLLMIGFYVVPITQRSWIQYFNCIPFDDTFCHNMDVSITRGASYTKYL
ncbi:inactive rhomboid protein 2-like isoform X4 [Mytilus californianus]|uniref:inactive rhomboid protein 2-like isoform X4 n=1 Tax=Mytilus californianus TaxID=6549 RepID=UPI0022455F81|nr:inactive rhomboid protein 2-like isoform X4 [Mytilus californianus]